MYAFRCRECGQLETPAHAGDQAVPHACRVCGAGLEWTKRGTKTAHPENWEVLSSATDEHLASYGLTRADVVEHKLLNGVILPFPKHVSQTAVDTSASEDIA